MEQYYESDELHVPADITPDEVTAEVAAVASEAGLVEASKVADKLDELRAPELLRLAARKAFEAGTLDRAVRHDIVVLQMGRRTAQYYRERRAANAAQRKQQEEIALEISTRKAARPQQSS